MSNINSAREAAQAHWPRLTWADAAWGYYEGVRAEFTWNNSLCEINVAWGQRPEKEPFGYVYIEIAGWPLQAIAPTPAAACAAMKADFEKLAEILKGELTDD